MKRVIIAMMVAICLATVGCNTGEVLEAVVIEESKIAVAVTKPQVMDMYNYVEFIGKAADDSAVNVFLRMQGMITAVHVKEGDIVKKGKVLIELDDATAKAQIKQAKAAVNSASASAKKASGSGADSARVQSEASISQAQRQYDNAIEAFESASKMYAIEAIPKNDFDQAEKAVDMALEQLDIATQSALISETGIEEGQVAANAGITQAQAGLDSAKIQLEYCKALAPCDGRIKQVVAKVGTPGSVQAPVVVIAENEKIQVQFGVPSHYTQTLKVGQEIQIEGTTQRGTATITEIAMMPEQTGMYTVKAVVNGDTMFLSGSEVKVSASVESAKGIVAVPLRTVRTASDGSMFLFKVKDNKAVKVNIEQGIVMDSFIEVKSGLDISDVVVLTDAPGLIDGALLNVVDGGN